MVRDEADIIGPVIGHMLGQVDEILALDNGSVDGSGGIMRDLGIEVIVDDEAAYYQSRKMSWLAKEAARRGTEWVVPFDADECWYSPHGRIGDVLASLTDCSVVVAPIYNHRPTGIDPDTPNPLTRMGWRGRSPLPLHKVACKPSLPVTIATGNHTADYEARRVATDDLLVVRHYPYRSAEQFVSKARNGAQALAATTLPEDAGKHWRDYGSLLDAHGPEALHSVFREHFWTADPTTDPSLIYDPCPM